MTDDRRQRTEVGKENVGILNAGAEGRHSGIRQRRISGIQKKTMLRWIPDLDFASSGMTFKGVSCFSIILLPAVC
jgi:hypothetical protein